MTAAILQHNGEDDFVKEWGRAGAVASIADEEGISTEEANTELGRRGRAGAVASIAKKMGISTEKASSEHCRRRRAGAVASIAKEMGISTEEASSEHGRCGAWIWNCCQL